MKNELTAMIEKDGDWFMAYCREIRGANGQGRTIVVCKADLGAAIPLILENRREDALRGLPPRRSVRRPRCVEPKEHGE